MQKTKIARTENTILFHEIVEYEVIYRTRSPAIARKSRSYRLHPKPSVRISFTERKRFVRGETVPCTLC